MAHEAVAPVRDHVRGAREGPPGSDIEDGISRRDAGVVQDPLPDWGRVLHRLGMLLGVISIAVVK